MRKDNFEGTRDGRDGRKPVDAAADPTVQWPLKSDAGPSARRKHLRWRGQKQRGDEPHSENEPPKLNDYSAPLQTFAV